MPITDWRDPAGPRPGWSLETRHTAYVLGLDSKGYVQHMYWGARLPLPSDYGSPDGPLPWSNFDRLSREEFPVWGDYNYSEPCLKLCFADGVRAGALEFEGAHIAGSADAAQLSLTFKDPHYPLRLRLVYRVLTAFDLIERWAVLENTGDQPIVIEQILSAMWRLPLRDSFQLTTLNGRWGAEFQIQRIDLPMGRQVVERRRAPPAMTRIPGSRSARMGLQVRLTAKSGLARWPSAAITSW